LGVTPASGSPEQKFWTIKQIIKVHFVKLRDDIISLGNAGFYKYVGSLVNKFPGAVKIRLKIKGKVWESQTCFMW